MKKAYSPGQTIGRVEEARSCQGVPDDTLTDITGKDDEGGWLEPAPATETLGNSGELGTEQERW